MNGWQRMFQRKPVEVLLQEGRARGGLKRTLGALDLVALGVGGIIGTGIFVLTGVAAARYAGPGLAVSFLISGTAAGLAALVYAEFASMLPAAGSAYTYTYASLGELPAWLIGWNLILEYIVASAAVAIGWGSYLADLLRSFGLILPKAFTAGPLAGGVLNLPPVFIIALVAAIGITGTRRSANLTHLMVTLKLGVVLLFIILGATRINSANWRPFFPFGPAGVMHGAAIIFFAYVGFDAVAAAGEEVKNPRRDLTIGIIGSLVLSTVLYVLVTLVLTGMVHYPRLNTASPIATALLSAGMGWASALVAIGALAGLTSVLLANLFAQSRVFFAMGRDGLLPPLFASLSSRFKTPAASLGIIATGVTSLAAFIPVEVVAQLANIGTLSAFLFVSAGLLVLRRRYPQLPRPFKTPFVPWTPLLAMAFSLYLIANLPPVTWIRLALWLAVGIAIYLFYGYRHSKRLPTVEPAAGYPLVPEPAAKPLPNENEPEQKKSS